MELGVLGFAALLLLLAIFFDRVSKITGPGGLGIDLTPDVKQHAAGILARRVRDRAGAAARAAGDSASLVTLEPIQKLRAMALSRHGYDESQVAASTEDATRGVAQASVLMTRYAEDLLGRSNNREALSAQAKTLGITDAADIEALEQGVVPDSVWARLADRSLSDLGVAE